MTITLALGIGACTAIYSAIDCVVAHAYDDPATERNVYLRSVRLPQRVDAGMSFPDFLDLEMQATSFEFMACHILRHVTLTGTDEPLQRRGATVTPRYFDIFGIKLALGRAFLRFDELDQPRFRTNDPKAINALRDREILKTSTLKYELSSEKSPAEAMKSLSKSRRRSVTWIRVFSSAPRHEL